MMEAGAFQAIAAEDYRRRCARVRLLLFDVDGVLTDGRLYLGAGGEEAKAFHVRDGQGLVMLRQAGIAFGAISGRRSGAVQRRLQELGAAHVVEGCSDKRGALEALRAEHGLEPGQLAFVGDDLPDLPALARAGVAIAVADADPGILPACHWRTRAAGGLGAVREVCEDLLAAAGELERLRSRALNGG